jgi:arylsulfatase A-like enzyme
MVLLVPQVDRVSLLLLTEENHFAAHRFMWSLQRRRSDVRLDQQVHPEWKKYMAVTQDGFKIIFNRDVFTFELYNLTTDPREERNLYSVMPEKAAQMTKVVLQYVDIVTASRPRSADEGRYSKAGGADGDKVED